MIVHFQHHAKCIVPLIIIGIIILNPVRPGVVFLKKEILVYVV